MASQSLYRKWRSQTFSDLVGQAEIVQTLKNALATGKLSHAYLFTGPRGTGKTSTARLLAKTLNCTNRKGGEPCNECEQCREITAGNSFNVIEIDAASNRGIDSIRELREKVMVRPSTGKYKIYILDEAHMLTTEAFNALLKTLEEPPEHAIFVMATTDVEKMPATVISRCQPFYFKRITTRQIVDHLLFVAEQEKIELERGAAELIARAAAGGMRDALSLLDQAIAYSGQSISLTQVQTMLGVADRRAIQKFVTHIAQLDSATGLHLIHELAESGADLRQINTQVAEYWRGMMLVKAGADISTILDSTEDEVKEMTQTAKLFALEELIDCARLFAQNELMQKNQGTPQLGLELAMLTAIERHRQGSNAQPAQSSQSQRSETPSYSRANVSSPVPATPSVQTPPVSSASSTSRPVAAQTPPVPVEPAPLRQEEQVKQPVEATRPVEREVKTEPLTQDEPTETSTELPEWESLSYDDEEEYEAPSVKPVTNEPTANVRPVTAPAASFNAPVQESQDSRSNEANVQEETPPFTLADVKEKWEQIKKRVKSRKEGSRLVGPLLNDFAVVAVQGTSHEAIILAQAAHPWHYEQIQQKDYHKLVEWALKIELGQECRIKFLSPTQSVTLPPPPTFLLPHTGGSSSTAPSFANGSNGSTPSTNDLYDTQSLAAKQQPQRGQATNGRDTEYTNGASPSTPLARIHTVRENTTGSVNVDNGSRVSNGNGPSFADTVHLEEPLDVKEAMEAFVTSSVATAVETAPIAAPIVLDETRRAQLERKAMADPIVQKVSEMFKASMKDVRPK